MPFGAKLLATFLLGAVTGFAAHKYMSMTDEQKEKLAADIKAKAKALIDEAETAADKASDYLETLVSKTITELKGNFRDLDSFFNDLSGKKATN